MPTLSILDDGFRVGVSSIDTEHELLLNELNQLLHDPADIPQSARFSEGISRIGLKILEHFAHEEAVLKSCGLPHAEVTEHIRAHGQILEQFTQLQFDLMLGKAVGHSATVEMIRSWIVTHLRVFDLQMKPYVSNRMLAAAMR